MRFSRANDCITCAYLSGFCVRLREPFTTQSQAGLTYWIKARISGYSDYFMS
jgi:hypothetical protein